MTELPARRLLLVHAHPDDESINNGATMARYAAEGARVTLVTCTLGERGEVIPPGAAASRPAPPSASTGCASSPPPCASSASTDFRLLGGPGRYRDSGMMGLADNDDPACFWQADVDEAAGHLVEVIREVRPQVLVTYDDNGGYGHPDHIQAHRVAMRAAELAAEAGWRDPPRSTGTACRGPSSRSAFARLAEELPGSAVRQGRRRRRRAGCGATTSGSPPRSTAPRTPPPRPPRCARTPRRSRWRSRTSRSRTSWRSPCSPPSTTSWCAGRTGRARPGDAICSPGPRRRR